MDRFVFLLRPQYDFGRKFTLEKTEPDAFWKMNHFLDQIAQPSGFLYKDVVQPFVMARWLKKRSFPTLIIRRPVADVVYAMTARGWNYPGIMFSNLMDNELAVVKGLARAARALDMIPGHFIDFDELVFSEEVVYRALRSFYPKVDARRVQYIDAKFEGVRGEILARRKTEKYQAIVEMLATDAGATSKA